MRCVGRSRAECPATPSPPREGMAMHKWAKPVARARAGTNGFTAVMVPIGLCLRLIGWHAQRSVAALAPIGAQAACCRKARAHVELHRHSAALPRAVQHGGDAMSKLHRHQATTAAGVSISPSVAFLSAQPHHRGQGKAWQCTHVGKARRPCARAHKHIHCSDCTDRPVSTTDRLARATIGRSAGTDRCTRSL
jgi:hypothetical protein